MSSGMPTASRVTFWFSLSKRREKPCCPFQSAQKTWALRVLKSRPRKYRQAGHMGLGDRGDAGLSECFLYDFSVPDSARLLLLHTSPLLASILRLCVPCWLPPSPVPPPKSLKAITATWPSFCSELSENWEQPHWFQSFPYQDRVSSLAETQVQSGRQHASSQHLLSTSCRCPDPLPAAAGECFQVLGTFFFPQVETNQLCRSLRSLPSVTAEALNPMALLLIGVIPTVSFHLPFQPWAIFASVLWGFSSFSLESGYVPKIICIFFNCLLVSILYVCGNSPLSFTRSVCHIAGTLQTYCLFRAHDLICRMSNAWDRNILYSEFFHIGSNMLCI